MSAAVIDGKLVSALQRQELKLKVQERLFKGFRAPGLAVILVGEDAASSIYVHNKRNACKEVGIQSYAYDLPIHTSQEQLLSLIDELNHRDTIDGILIQLPLPKHIDQQLIIERIKPQKDVDGFHPYNLGRLAQRSPLLRPCTPMGIMSLLAYYQLDVQGKHAVVIGASNIVGRPMSLELLLAGATVTICHKFTSSLESFVSQADLIIVATGVMDLVNVKWLKKHQILIDVGIHRLSDGRIRGDIDFDQAYNKVSWITPVPGGVGPMTVASLLKNTLNSANSTDL